MQRATTASWFAGACLLLGTGLRAQAITWSAAAATTLTAQVQSSTTGNATQSLPAGTPLPHGTIVQAASGFSVASITVSMPTPTSPYRLDGSAFASGGDLASFRGDTLLTYAAADPTAVDLRLTASGGGWSLSGSVDVGSNGTPELSIQSTTTATTIAPAVLGPGPLLVRTSMMGQPFQGGTGVQLEVAIAARLAAISTVVVGGCGPWIVVAPTSTQSVRVITLGLPPAGLSVLAIGVGADNVQLPFGGCLLGVGRDWLLPLTPDPAGIARLDFGVPAGVSSLTLHAQAVGFQFSTPWSIVTSDALRVWLRR